jgi:hypothetical protein
MSLLRPEVQGVPLPFLIMKLRISCRLIIRLFHDCSQLHSLYFISLALQPPWALDSAFHFHDHFTDGRNPWTRNQLVPRPLPKHRTTQTQNKHIHTPNIHALCWIRTHDPSFQASENSSCLRPLGYRDRRIVYIVSNIPVIWKESVVDGMRKKATVPSFMGPYERLLGGSEVSSKVSNHDKQFSVRYRNKNFNQELRIEN